MKQKIRDLLEKAIDCAKDKNIKRLDSIDAKQTYKWIMQDMFSCIDQALALLKQPQTVFVVTETHRGCTDIVGIFTDEVLAGAESNKCEDMPNVTKWTVQDCVSPAKQPECKTCGGTGIVRCTNPHDRAYWGDVKDCPDCQKPDEKPPASEFTKEVRALLNIPNDETSQGEAYTKDLEELTRIACDRLDKAEAEIKTFAEWRSGLEKLAKSDNAVVKTERAKADQFQDEVQELKHRIKELESFLQQLLWIAEKKPTDDSEDTTVKLAERFLKEEES